MASVEEQYTSVHDESVTASAAVSPCHLDQGVPLIVCSTFSASHPCFPWWCQTEEPWREPDRMMDSMALRSHSVPLSQVVVMPITGSLASLAVAALFASKMCLRESESPVHVCPSGLSLLVWVDEVVAAV